MVLSMREKVIKIIKAFIIALLSSICFGVQITKKYKINYNLLFMILSFIILFFLYHKFYNKKQFKIISVVFALFCIIGDSFDKTNSFKLISHNHITLIINTIRLLGFSFIFNFLINKFYYLVEEKEFKNKKNKLYDFLFEKHPFIIPFIIILIFYLPYIISFYPGILSPDPSNQIKQFFHIKTNYLDYTTLIDPNVYITNHHPVLHTILLGGLAKIGDIMGNVNFGIFMYTILQLSLFIGTMSYTLCYMRKLNVPHIIRLVVLTLYCIIPVFPFYAMSAVKDVIFSCLLVIYSIRLYDIIRFKPNYNFKLMASMFILMLLITLFRNNGIQSILFTSIPVVILVKYERIKNLIISICVISVYLMYSNLLLPSLKISNGSVRERLSIPFQQTARLVKYYEDELSNEEKIKIDKVLGIDDLGSRYNPVNADPVKNAFNKYATKGDMDAYFGVWLKYFFKKPNVYFEATINNIYGYFYPKAKRWYIYYKYDNRLINDNIDYHYNNLKNTRNILSNYGVAFRYIPIIGLIVSVGFNTWLVMLLITFLLHKKLFRYIPYVVPLLSLILMCFSSPINTYFRYIFGVVLGMPILWSMYYALKNNN